MSRDIVKQLIVDTHKDVIDSFTFEKKLDEKIIRKHVIHQHRNGMTNDNIEH